MRTLLFLLLFAPILAVKPASPFPEIAEKTDAPEPRRIIYIITSDNDESSMIKGELTRDWTKATVELTGNSIKIAKVLNEVRAGIGANFDVKFVDMLDASLDLKYDMCPYIKVGEYGSYQSIDKKAFTDTSLPLLTIKYYCELARETHWKDARQERFFDIRAAAWAEDSKQKAMIAEEIKKRWKMPEGFKTGNAGGFTIYAVNDVAKIYGFDPKFQKWEVILDKVRLSGTNAYSFTMEMDYFKHKHFVLSDYNVGRVFMFKKAVPKEGDGESGFAAPEYEYRTDEFDLQEYFKDVDIDLSQPVEPFPMMEIEMRLPWMNGSTCSLDYLLDPPSEFPTR